MEEQYDAIVVGSGISGGWAAMELCKKGLKTIVLERGRQVEHIKDYPTTNLAPWELLHRNRNTNKIKEDQHIQVRGFCNEANSHFFVNDKEHPYVQKKTLRLDQGLSCWWKKPDVGKTMLSLE